MQHRFVMISKKLIYFGWWKEEVKRKENKFEGKFVEFYCIGVEKSSSRYKIAKE